MDDRFDSDDMPPELRLAAIVTLLSASALRGPTVAKTGALRAHLDAILADTALPPNCAMPSNKPWPAGAPSNATRPRSACRFAR